MLLSLEWLRDYLQKPDVKIKPEWLADKLTMRGIAVDKITHSSNSLDHVVVGKIEKIEPHPNADKLQITQTRVSEDPKEAPLQIVCGAKNIAEGDMVPVALIGAVLPGNITIKKSKIRDIESSGMLCSGAEMSIPDDSDGILKLPKNAHIGDQVGKLIGRKEDTIFEFDLTPNRGDCLSVLGIARESAPLLKTKVRELKTPRFRITPHRTSSIVELKVEDETLCPRYVARVVDNLKVEESPDWIKERLESVGIVPINNIVDITNFVMLETGQPLHAFDLRKIESGALTVTQAKCAMDFEVLGGQTVELQEGDVLIQDGERPVALAGIMGGANTMISEDTTSIVLESAIFPSARIRKTAKRLALHTDASKRFERGTDIEMVAFASERAAALLRECCDANVYHPPIDTNSVFERETFMNVDMREVRSLTGIWNLSTDKAAELLEAIAFSVSKRSTNILTVGVPRFRNDIVHSIDLIEEIARLVGYDAIPLNYPISDACFDKYNEQAFDMDAKARQALTGCGLSEAIHYSFTSETTLKKFGLEKENMISLVNPISEEMKVMRPSLLGSLLETYDYNRNRKKLNQRIFEIAKVYEANADADTKAKETSFVAGLLSGNAPTASWNKDETPVDFFTAKGLVNILVDSLSTHSFHFEPCKTHKLFHPSKSAVLKLGSKEVGFVGELHPFVQKDVIKSTEPVVLFEFNLDALKRYEKKNIKFQNPSKFPSVDFDLSLIVDKATSNRELQDTLTKTGGKLLSSVEVFDVYEGDNIPMGKKSLAFHLEFVSTEKTLNEEETTELVAKMREALTEKHQAQIRE